MYLAAYTTPITKNSGYCWIWRHSAISEELCNLCYTKIKKPRDILSWESDHFNTGFIRLNSEWSALYRILNAGRDSFGRAGRFFLIVGFIPSTELVPFELKGNLFSPIFSKIIEEIPQKNNLEIPLQSIVTTNLDRSEVPDLEICEKLQSWHEIQQVALKLIANANMLFTLHIEGNDSKIIGKLSKENSPILEKVIGSDTIKSQKAILESINEYKFLIILFLISISSGFWCLHFIMHNRQSASAASSISKKSFSHSDKNIPSNKGAATSNSSSEHAKGKASPSPKSSSKSSENKKTLSNSTNAKAHSSSSSQIVPHGS